MNLKSDAVEFLASQFARSYYLTQIARRVAQRYDNDGNADIRKNGERLLLGLMVARRPGGTILDVGANKGDWSADVIDCGFRGRLLAVDPLQVNIANIEQRFAGRAGFETAMYALTNRIGTAEFFSNVNSAESGTDSLFDMKTIGYSPNLKVVPVQCTTLDQLASDRGLSRIDFLKIDVEGNEFFALEGARSLLSSAAIDFIQIEYGHAARAARIYLHDIVQLAEGHGYDMFVIKPKGFMPLRFTPFIENRYSYINLLLVRRGCAAELTKHIIQR